MSPSPRKAVKKSRMVRSTSPRACVGSGHSREPACAALETKSNAAAAKAIMGWKVFIAPNLSCGPVRVNRAWKGLQPLATRDLPSYKETVITRLLFLTGLMAVAPASVAQETAPPPAREEAAPPEQKPRPPAIFDAIVIGSYPHDPNAFTQGLLWHEGWLYESTGRIGTSSVRQVELATGKVAMERAIPYPQFGEGLALWDDELVSLTWRNGVIHRWKLDDLSPVSSYPGYPHEGWGLARLNDQLVASDGSATLRFLDPADYSLERELTVTLNGKPLAQLNELEVVNGLILANVWKTNFIVIIDPGDGAVRAIIDCRGLPEYEGDDPEAVLNGIAWDAQGERLFVTGKLWPQLHEVELRRRQPVRPGN